MVVAASYVDASQESLGWWQGLIAANWLRVGTKNPTKCSLVFLARISKILKGPNGVAYGYARPAMIKLIEGQNFVGDIHNTAPDRPLEPLSVGGAVAYYGSRMASLAELLDYGIKVRRESRKCLVCVVWNDVFGQFWYALVRCQKSSCELSIFQCDPNLKLHHDVTYLSASK